MMNLRHIIQLSGCFLCVLLFVSSCSPHEYKDDADKEAYAIIEQKWDARHGTQANMKIDDVQRDPNDLLFDPNYVPTGPLKLADAVAIATARNRDYQKQKESLYIRALDLTLSRHQFARKWFGTIDARYNRGENDETITAGGQFGFSQFLDDGTQISTSIATDWMRYLTGDPRESLGSVLSASISKPLLRGAGKDIVQENLTQAERNVLYQIRSFSQYRKDFVVTIVSEYFRVLQALDSVHNSESNYKSLQLSYAQATLSAEAGRIPQLEADQTEQRMLAAKDDLTRAQRNYLQALDSFKIRLAMTTDAPLELDPNALQTLMSQSVTEPTFPAEEAVATAIALRLDLATSKDEVDDAKRKVKVAENALQAKLNLTGGARVHSTAETDFDRLRFHEGDYSFGAELDLPFDRKAERNAYRESLITLMQKQRDYENSLDTVKLEVRNNYRNVIEAARRYHIQKISLELAQKRVDSTQILFKAGRVQARDLLDSQEALLQTQNATTSTLVDYMIATLSFYRDIELLSVKPDGLWQIPDMAKRNEL